MLYFIFVAGTNYFNFGFQNKNFTFHTVGLFSLVIRYVGVTVNDDFTSQYPRVRLCMLNEYISYYAWTYHFNVPYAGFKQIQDIVFFFPMKAINSLPFYKQQFWLVFVLRLMVYY
jgi:hypothetical protein